MASPQIENGYVKIANELIEQFSKLKLNGSEWQVLMVVIRKTWGFNKIEDEISLSQFVLLTGLNRSQVCKSINSLVSKLILGIKNDTHTNKYFISKDYDKWIKVVSKMTPSIKNDTTPSIKFDTRSSIKSDNRGSIKSDTYKRHLLQKTFIKDKRDKDSSALFDEFWKVYPRKIAKPTARKAFDRAFKESKQNGLFLPSLLKSIELNKQSKQWQDVTYVPHPATWLNQKRFNDDVIISETLEEKNKRVLHEMGDEVNDDIFK